MKCPHALRSSQSPKSMAQILTPSPAANVFWGASSREFLALCPGVGPIWLLVPSSHKKPLNVLYGQTSPAVPSVGLECSRISCLTLPFIMQSFIARDSCSAVYFTTLQFSCCFFNCLYICLPSWSMSELTPLILLALLLVIGTSLSSSPTPTPGAQG